jgi:hypothetical protein
VKLLPHVSNHSTGLIWANKGPELNEFESANSEM